MIKSLLRYWKNNERAHTADIYSEADAEGKAIAALFLIILFLIALSVGIFAGGVKAFLIVLGISVASTVLIGFVIGLYFLLRGYFLDGKVIDLDNDESER